jgi:hypothetical protein
VTLVISFYLLLVYSEKHFPALFKTVTGDITSVRDTGTQVQSSRLVPIFFARYIRIRGVELSEEISKHKEKYVNAAWKILF